MTDTYDQREDLHAATVERARMQARQGPLESDQFDALYVLSVARKANTNDLRSRFLAAMYQLALRDYVFYECHSNGLCTYRLTSLGKARMQAEIDLRERDSLLPQLAYVLTDEAAARVRRNGERAAQAYHAHTVTINGKYTGFLDCVVTPAPVEKPEEVEPPCAPAAPLRARLYADGSMVIDNPAKPLAVRPMAHTGSLEADPITFEIDADVAWSMALLLKQLIKL